MVGAVSGGMAIAQAVAGPVRGRVANCGSAARVLDAGVGYAIGLLLLVAAVAVLISFLTGPDMPPISQIRRATWPQLA
ncbi:hypothetical protein ACWEWX_02760 [Streptomyces asiaticus]